MSLSLKPTNDGSFTLFNADLNETYHSIHGARQEGEHVFIKNGLNRIDKNAIRILEVGLGTGLNVFLTAIHLGKKQIDYVGLEPYPIEPKLLESFILQSAKTPQELDIWKTLMLGETSVTKDSFKFKKVNATLLDYTSNNKFDLIYFDAFAPNKQSELWTIEVFVHLFNLCNPNARLVTYCAQGQFKRNLKSAGFLVKSLPGPPGKREMTVGVKGSI